jgi:hypothetical protein
LFVAGFALALAVTLHWLGAVSALAWRWLGAGSVPSVGGHSALAWRGLCGHLANIFLAVLSAALRSLGGQFAVTLQLCGVASQSILCNGWSRYINRTEPSSPTLKGFAMAYLVFHDAFDNGAMEVWPSFSIETATASAQCLNDALDAIGEECGFYRAYQTLPRKKIFKSHASPR